MNAKVELWGTSSHIKQVAEIYNDNGQSRPFASIIDVPGGSNTIAVYNTGPMVYPIKVVVEPVARMEGSVCASEPGAGGAAEEQVGARRPIKQHCARAWVCQGNTCHAMPCYGWLDWWCHATWPAPSPWLG